MLAGKMKLTHFLGLVGLGAAGVLGTLGWWWSNRPVPPPHSIASTPSAPAAAAANPPSHPANAGVVDYQVEAMSWAGRNVGSDKAKDVSAGKPYKINVYQDAGHGTANRLKVDLDRDDKWDEKWTFGNDGSIRREVAPADDEIYAYEQVWTGSEWSGGPPSEDEFPPVDPPEEPAADAGPLALLPAAEQAAMGWKGRALGSDKLKDVTKGESYKINVYQDAGQATANRLKIDLDRDDKWDQKWTFHDDGQVSREVAPNDDETYTIAEVWGSGGWVGAP